MTTGEFRFHGWLVQPQLNRLVSAGRTVHLRPRTMDVLAYLARSAGLVVPREELLGAIWQGQRIEEEGLTHCVTELRSALADDARHPTMVETIPKRGYRLMNEVQWMTGPATTAAAASSGLVVLPLEALGPDRGDDGLAEGLTEAITAALSRSSWLRVVSRTTSRRIGPARDLHEIAARLRVRYALEGCVRRAGHEVVVSVRLLDAEVDAMLWSEVFTAELGDVLQLEERVARSVAASLESVLPEGAPDATPTAVQTPHPVDLCGQPHGSASRRPSGLVHVCRMDVEPPQDGWALVVWDGDVLEVWQTYPSRGAAEEALRASGREPPASPWEQEPEVG